MKVYTCNSSHYWYTENNLSIGLTQQLPPSHCLWMQVDFVLHGKCRTSLSPCTTAGRGAGSKGIPPLVCASSYHDPVLDQVHCIFTDCNRALFLCQKMSSGPPAPAIFWILFFFFRTVANESSCFLCCSGLSVAQWQKQTAMPAMNIRSGLGILGLCQ